MATLFGVIAIGVFILLMVVAGRNKLVAHTRDSSSGGDSDRH